MLATMATTRPVGRAVTAAQEALGRLDPARPSEALPHRREASERLAEAIDEAMAAVILEEGGSIRAAGALAGLSENAVGPRLAPTAPPAADTAESGRGAAQGGGRALYDLERGHGAPDAAPRPPPRVPAPPSKD